MIDEVASEVALTRWGFPERLHVPVAALDEAAREPAPGRAPWRGHRRRANSSASSTIGRSKEAYRSASRIIAGSLIQFMRWTVAALTRDNGAMKEVGEIGDHKLQMLVLERRDPRYSMARFYVLAIEPTLFGNMAPVREWGRIGSLGRRRLDLYSDLASTAEALDVWLTRKARRGYRVRALRLQS